MHFIAEEGSPVGGKKKKLMKVHDCLSDTERVTYKPYKAPQMPETDSLAISQEITYLKRQKQMLIDE